MSKLTRPLVAAALVALSMLHWPAGAAEGDELDINDYLCKDIMRMSDNERAISLGVLHGYRMGKKGATRFVSEDLSEMSNDFIEYCLDNPHEKALASFEKVAK